METAKIKAVIFDMDGVLVDSEEVERECMKQSAALQGLPFEDKFYELFLGCNEKMSIKILVDRYHDEHKVQQMMKDFVTIEAKAYEDGMVKLKKGCQEILSYLQDKGLPYALATGSSRRYVEIDFLNNGYEEVPFEYIVTGDQITNSKPDPEIYLKAASAMGINIKDCLIVEDSPKGIEAARVSGALTCLVPDLAAPDEEMLRKADHFCEDLFAVKELIETLTDKI